MSNKINQVLQKSTLSQKWQRSLKFWSSWKSVPPKTSKLHQFWPSSCSTSDLQSPKGTTAAPRANPKWLPQCTCHDLSQNIPQLGFSNWILCKFYESLVGYCGGNPKLGPNWITLGSWSAVVEGEWTKPLNVAAVMSTIPVPNSSNVRQPKDHQAQRSNLTCQAGNTTRCLNFTAKTCAASSVEAMNLREIEMILEGNAWVSMGNNRTMRRKSNNFAIYCDILS